MADLDGAFVKSLFVLEVSNRLKVAGGKFDDISLEVPENAEFLTQLENAVGKTENDISIGDITNIDLGKDLMLTGKNPHLPLDVDIIRIPLLANLSARAKRFVEKRLFKGRDVPDDVPEGLRDMQAMAVMATMTPEQRRDAGIDTTKRVRINTCERARQLEAEWEQRRRDVAAKVQAAKEASQK
ncbi:hypothetical protein CYMTET_53213 [Cymbomonas tetramitiformis]|uniref:Uncharacterized protein n=1 Tax=Cymbomonas tetramitiformis TaxID=36881 RepID=A0AAE0BIV6_9CHLO|nr:hypothetical protein CYMTET_53213 [Cymbomonas tetramitiformis]|eukprot:gene12569-14853_t